MKNIFRFVGRGKNILSVQKVYDKLYIPKTTFYPPPSRQDYITDSPTTRYKHVVLRLCDLYNKLCFRKNVITSRQCTLLTGIHANVHCDAIVPTNFYMDVNFIIIQGKNYNN